MAKNNLPEGVKTMIYWVMGLAIVGLIGLVMLILFGNLSGNVGFAEGTQGYNDTQAVIGNFTGAVRNTAGLFPTVGTILGVGLLLGVLIGILVLAVKKLMGAANATSGSNSNFAD